MDDPVWLGSNSGKEERAGSDRVGVKLNALIDARPVLQGEPGAAGSPAGMETVADATLTGPRQSHP
jgi:hypothetical protein